MTRFGALCRGLHTGPARAPTPAVSTPAIAISAALRARRSDPRSDLLDEDRAEMDFSASVIAALRPLKLVSPQAEYPAGGQMEVNRIRLQDLNEALSVLARDTVVELTAPGRKDQGARRDVPHLKGRRRLRSLKDHATAPARNPRQCAQPPRPASC